MRVFIIVILALLILAPTPALAYLDPGTGSMIIQGNIGAIAGFHGSGRSFLPEFNEGSHTIAAVTLPGTSLAESDDLGRLVENTVLSHPEVIAVARRTGRAELDEHAQGVEASEMEVSLKIKDRSKAEFLAALRNDLTHVPGTNITIGQPISHRIDHMLSGAKANVAIKIFGSDLYKLARGK